MRIFVSTRIRGVGNNFLRTAVLYPNICRGSLYTPSRGHVGTHGQKRTAKLEYSEKIIGLERTIVFTVVRGAQEVDAAALLVRNSPSFLVVTFDSEYHYIVVVALLEGCRRSLYTVKAWPPSCPRSPIVESASLPPYERSLGMSVERAVGQF